MSEAQFADAGVANSFMSESAENQRPLTDPPTRKGQATRKRLLRAAESEIGEQGFHGASISGITQRAGVGQGTFYLYFRSKEDVLRELVQDLGQELRGRLSTAAQTSNGRMEAERAGMRAFLEFVKDRPDLYRVLMECQSVDLDVFQRYYLDFAAGYLDELYQAEEDEEITPGDLSARTWAIMGMNHFLGMRWPLWQGEMPPESVIETAIDLIANGMSNKKSSKKTASKGNGKA